jgi:acetyltransferase
VMFDPKTIALIGAAGFKEFGEEGTQLEGDIDPIRKKYGMRIMGPNCLGFVRPVLGLNVTFLRGNPPPGNIALSLRAAPSAARYLIGRSAPA